MAMFPTYAHFPGAEAYRVQTCGGCGHCRTGKARANGKKDVSWCRKAQEFSQVEDHAERPDTVKPGGG